MQTDNNNNPTPQFYQTNDPLALAALIEAELGTPGRTIIELCAAPQPLTPKAALTIGALACEYLLTGEPHPATFEAADLEQALSLLRQMAALSSRR
jgi:hypothetical protein